MQEMFIERHNCTYIHTKTIFERYNKCELDEIEYDEIFKEFFSGSYIDGLFYWLEFVYSLILALFLVFLLKNIEICLPQCPLGIKHRNYFLFIFYFP